MSRSSRCVATSRSVTESPNCAEVGGVAAGLDIERCVGAAQLAVAVETNPPALGVDGGVEHR